MPETLPIFNREAEEALVGHAIIDPERLSSVDISAEDFYVHRHRTIWQAIESLKKRSVTVDLITLIDELDRAGALGEVGGPAELTGLINIVPGFQVDHHAALVREGAQRRRMLQLANDIAKTAYNRQEPVDQRLGEFIDRLSNLGTAEKGAVHWSKFISELYDEIEERAKNPKDIWGIPTGFPEFDKITGGLQRGESLILSGRPGVGKSMLAIQIGKQMAEAQAKFPGAIYSLEMTGMQVLRRSVSAQAQINTRKLKTGRIEDHEWTAISAAIETLDLLPVYMADTVGWTTTALRADLARLKTHGVCWFVFDYMMLASDSPALDETERTALISRNVKLLCRELDLAGVLIHSMIKSSGSTPDPFSLRGSGQVGYDADVICFLTEFQPMSEADKSISRKDRDNLRTLLFGKGRELENPKKYTHMVKNPGFPSFADYTPEPNAQRADKSNGRFW